MKYDRECTLNEAHVKTSAFVLPVYPYEPVLCSVCFFQVSEVEILVSNDGVTSTIKASWRLIIQFEISETIVGQFIHQTVEECRSALVVNAEFAALGEVVALANFVGMFALGNANHPQELVNVVAGVAHHATEND